MSVPNTNIKYPVNILRNTGARSSMIQESCLPNVKGTYTGEKSIAVALGVHRSCPVAEVYLESPIYTGLLKVLVINQSFDVPNTQMLIGNEMKGCSK